MDARLGWLAGRLHPIPILVYISRMREIADLLHEARSSAGLTQAEVARRAGTSQPAVARYEQGAALPTLPTPRRLPVACGRGPVISARSPQQGRDARLGPPERA